MMDARGNARPVVMVVIGFAVVVGLFVMLCISEKQRVESARREGRLEAERDAARKAERERAEKLRAAEAEKRALEEELAAATQPEDELAQMVERVKAVLEPSVQLNRTNHFSRPRRVEDGDYRIVTHGETIWLQVSVSNGLPPGLEIRYQLYDRLPGRGRGKVCPGASGQLVEPVTTTRSANVFHSPFIEYQWEIREGRTGLLTGKRYEGYRVDFFWRGVHVGQAEENVPVSAQTAHR